MCCRKAQEHSKGLQKDPGTSQVLVKREQKAEPSARTPAMVWGACTPGFWAGEVLPGDKSGEQIGCVWGPVEPRGEAIR